jgi:hypothetical protein
VLVLAIRPQGDLLCGCADDHESMWALLEAVLAMLTFVFDTPTGRTGATGPRLHRMHRER